jgi:hypothetical protein
VPTMTDVTTRALELGSGAGLVAGAGFGVLLDAVLGLPAIGLVLGSGVGLTLGAGLGIAFNPARNSGDGAGTKPARQG